MGSGSLTVGSSYDDVRPIQARPASYTAQPAVPTLPSLTHQHTCLAVHTDVSSPMFVVDLLAALPGDYIVPSTAATTALARQNVYRGAQCSWRLLRLLPVRQAPLLPLQTHLTSHHHYHHHLRPCAPFT